MWTIMVDYREDMRISDDMIKRVAEAYRKVRNTIRYLLSNLNDFDPARDTVAGGGPRRARPLRPPPPPAGRRPRARRLRCLRVPPRLPPARAVRGVRPLVLLPRRAEGPALLRRRRRVDGAARPRPCSTKIAAGPVPPPGPRPALHHRRGLALRPRPPGALRAHLALFPARETADEALLSRWAGLLDVRAEVTKALEDARAAKHLAASLEAAVVLRGPAGALEPLRAHEAKSHVFPGNLANLFIVSAVRLEEAEAPFSGLGRARPGAKCERCWTWSKVVGTLAVHPGVCERCAEVLAHP